MVVTGGCGFIGSHLVDRLLESDNQVLVIDDFSTGSERNLAHHSHNPKLFIEKADVINEKEIIKLIRGFHFVFHLAARNVRLSLRQPSQVHEINATGTLNVLKACAAAGVERFLYCSSSEVNGSAGFVPMVEDYIFRPETIYGASKLAGEYYTLVFHRSGWLKATIARPHNNYGPREHFDGIKGEVIPIFILLALAGKAMVIYGDGCQTRDFTYVIETADYMVRLLEHDGALGNVFNICRGEEVSINTLSQLILEMTEATVSAIHVTARPSDVLRLYGDPTRLGNLLGSPPKVSIQEGLRFTINWFRDNISISDRVLEGLRPYNWSDLDEEPWLSELRLIRCNVES